MPRMFKFNILIHHSLSWNINTLYDHFAIQILPPSHEKCNSAFEKKNPTNSAILEVGSQLPA